jgi:hypothetical protein
MNDPGLHEPAQEAAQDVEKNEHREDEQAEQEEQEFLDPRYAISKDGRLTIAELIVSAAGGLHQRHVL